jgi:hypothetical protein
MNRADKWRTRAKKLRLSSQQRCRAQSVGSDECRRIESDQIVFAISIRGTRWQERRCVVVRLIGSYVNTSSCRVPLVRPVTGQKYFAPLRRSFATCQHLCSPCATHSIKLMGRPDSASVARFEWIEKAIQRRRTEPALGRTHKKNQWPRSQWSGMGAYTHVKATHKHSVPSGCVMIAPHRCHSRSAISVINFFVGRAAADSFDYRLARFIRLALRVTNKRRVCVSLMLNQ